MFVAVKPFKSSGNSYKKYTFAPNIKNLFNSYRHTGHKLVERDKEINLKMLVFLR